MPRLRVKPFLPRSLIGRTALILLVPILTIQAVVSYVFIQRLYENVTVQMTRSILPEIALVIDLIEEAPDAAAAAQAIARPAAALNLQVVFTAERPPADDRVLTDFSGRVVTRELYAALPALVAVDLASNSRRVRLAVDTPHGPARIDFARNRVSATNPHQLLVLMVFVATIVTLISFLFLKNQVRPIRRLAEAAAAFGKGQALDYRPAGATEVRLAGAAFLEMRARIERHLEQRTMMLSGVSHDLRTPLTRLRLGLAMMPEDAESRALLGDVSEMEAMLDSFLDFVRADAIEETVPVDPAELAARVVEKGRRGGGTLELGAVDGSGRVPMRAMSVERALGNLVGNALRYGNRAVLSVALTERAVRFRVEDDGPGIPAELRDEAMKPFTRLDPARNQDRGGGAGLGLSIVRDVARGHGGSVRLSESAALGGLQADLIIAR